MGKMCAQPRQNFALEGREPLARGGLPMKPLISGVMVLMLSGPAFAQDPQAIMNHLLQRQLIESEQRFHDRQRQRELDRQEAAYDRGMCINAGYPGPDIEQCVRDSAAWRRGARPGAQQGGGPFIECTTIGLGDGDSSTVCR